MKKILTLAILLFLLGIIPALTAKPTQKLTPEEIADANDYIQSLPIDEHKPVKDIWTKGKKIKWTAKALKEHEIFHDKVNNGDITRKKRVDGKLVDVVCDIAYVEHLMRRGNQFDPNDIQHIGNRKKSPIDGRWRHGSDPND